VSEFFQTYCADSASCVKKENMIRALFGLVRASRIAAPTDAVCISV